MRASQRTTSATGSRPWCARTRGPGAAPSPGRDLDLEALVIPTANGREAWEGPLLSPEHNTVIEMCQRSVSVAEIAASSGSPSAWLG